MGLSSDQQARQKQLANLRPGARTVHGAQSQTLLEPLRERHRAELLADYPAIGSRRLALLSDLFARIELASSYLDRAGLVKDRRTLEPRPLVKLLDQWQTKITLRHMIGRKAQISADGAVRQWPACRWCSCRRSQSVDSAISEGMLRQ
jgi:hypothetical protein